MDKTLAMTGLMALIRSVVVKSGLTKRLYALANSSGLYKVSASAKIMSPTAKHNMKDSGRAKPISLHKEVGAASGEGDDDDDVLVIDALFLLLDFFDVESSSLLVVDDVSAFSNVILARSVLEDAGEEELTRSLEGEFLSGILVDLMFCLPFSCSM